MTTFIGCENSEVHTAGSFTGPEARQLSYFRATPAGIDSTGVLRCHVLKILQQIIKEFLSWIPERANYQFNKPNSCSNPQQINKYSVSFRPGLRD